MKLCEVNFSNISDLEKYIVYPTTIKAKNLNIDPSESKSVEEYEKKQLIKFKSDNVNAKLISMLPSFVPDTYDKGVETVSFHLYPIEALECFFQMSKDNSFEYEKYVFSFLKKLTKTVDFTRNLKI